MIDEVCYPRFAIPMTIIAESGVVHLIGGEDVRYTLTVGEADDQFAELLRACNGARSISELLLTSESDTRSTLVSLIERLYAERILIDGGTDDLSVFPKAEYRIHVEGEGPLLRRFGDPATDQPAVSVLCQSNLDFHTVGEFNRRCRKGTTPWMWISTGPVQRAFVSPLFLPDTGPCLTCLLNNFQRLSPTPHLYDALNLHGQSEGPFDAAPASERVLAMLEQLVRWKVETYQKSRPVLSVFRLHVLETATMEVSVHRVFRDPLCQECGYG